MEVLYTKQNSARELSSNVCEISISGKKICSLTIIGLQKQKEHFEFRAVEQLASLSQQMPAAAMSPSAISASNRATAIFA